MLPADVGNLFLHERHSGLDPGPSLNPFLPRRQRRSSGVLVVSLAPWRPPCHGAFFRPGTGNGARRFSETVFSFGQRHWQRRGIFRRPDRRSSEGDQGSKLVKRCSPARSGFASSSSNWRSASTERNDCPSQRHHFKSRNGRRRSSLSFRLIVLSATLHV